MYARTALLTLAVLACFTASRGALTPPDIVSNINTLTATSQALQAPAQRITIMNGTLIIIGQGPFPQILSGLTELVSIVTSIITKFEGTTISNTKEAQAVTNAYREFVRVHQELQNILIGKAGLFTTTTVPFIGQPVANSLRTLEAVLDTFSHLLIDTLESSASKQVKADADSLHGTIETAIKQYDQIATIASPRTSRKVLSQHANAVAA